MFVYDLSAEGKAASVVVHPGRIHDKSAVVVETFDAQEKMISVIVLFSDDMIDTNR